VSWRVPGAESLSEVRSFAAEAKSYLALGRPKDAQNLSLLYTLQTDEYMPKGSRYMGK